MDHYPQGLSVNFRRTLVSYGFHLPMLHSCRHFCIDLSNHEERERKTQLTKTLSQGVGRRKLGETIESCTDVCDTLGNEKELNEEDGELSGIRRTHSVNGNYETKHHALN